MMGYSTWLQYLALSNEHFQVMSYENCPCDELWALSDRWSGETTLVTKFLLTHCLSVLHSAFHSLPNEKQDHSHKRPIEGVWSLS